MEEITSKIKDALNLLSNLDISILKESDKFSYDKLNENLPIIKNKLSENYLILSTNKELFRIYENIEYSVNKFLEIVDKIYKEYEIYFIKNKKLTDNQKDIYEMALDDLINNINKHKKSLENILLKMKLNINNKLEFKKEIKNLLFILYSFDGLGGVEEKYGVDQIEGIFTQFNTSLEYPNGKDNIERFYLFRVENYREDLDDYTNSIYSYAELLCEDSIKL